MKGWQRVGVPLIAHTGPLLPSKERDIHPTQRKLACGAMPSVIQEGQGEFVRPAPLGRWKLGWPAPVRWFGGGRRIGAVVIDRVERAGCGKERDVHVRGRRCWEMAWSSIARLGPCRTRLSLWHRR